ncbi:unnamed protein product, partial [Timema podura]|nr:unnamed protein product [Timema podura]
MQGLGHVYTGNKLSKPPKHFFVIIFLTSNCKATDERSNSCVIERGIAKTSKLSHYLMSLNQPDKCFPITSKETTPSPGNECEDLNAKARVVEAEGENS